MSISLEQRNRLIYIAIAAVEIIAGWAMATIASGGWPELQDPYRNLVILLLGPAITALGTWLMANRPRWGKAEIAAQVDTLGETRAMVALENAERRKS